jgi:hypothetical protein
LPCLSVFTKKGRRDGQPLTLGLPVASELPLGSSVDISGTSEPTGLKGAIVSLRLGSVELPGESISLEFAAAASFAGMDESTVSSFDEAGLLAPVKLTEFCPGFGVFSAWMDPFNSFVLLMAGASFSWSISST